ncbi:hypothetical protein PCC6311_1424 [Synechococcus elongatus PCC 6311]|uniref:Uncharacterized protein n=3 Tax=Synechococcus elongatus TaxID=32046 RepID=Q31NH7_SYNE7|nr:hypothetical protein [Synechococcus elongatus]ABB57392.1 conserved hypothetical protein [Synechococcus elongatus PCC 7942 = FACHB-805]AJD58102.1 hypothetical protein M744_09805 [Synechococcus elongatus UTEX 2973]MBD2587799.1 hypothetical protein [Synechococcus elongatus FACHB-242]UOW71177.1 hypothetical protein PCC7943_1424 [Synechococcus elongatus PCC 7943]UOW73898.1 hypothetical protein PCC6311_1424 [Synechococcus elongatus PCC 6311]UOW76618.1 hypothetical protein PCC6301pg_1424 [Synecho
MVSSRWLPLPILLVMLLEAPAWGQFNNARSLLAELRRVGVRVTQACEPGLLGSFSDRRREIRICPEAHDSDDEVFRTLVHESWHVVQNCLANQGRVGTRRSRPIARLRPDLVPKMLRETRRSDLRIVRSQYAPEDQLLELEARWLENYPEVVENGLQTICR